MAELLKLVNKVEHAEDVFWAMPPRDRRVVNIANQLFDWSDKVTDLIVNEGLTAVVAEERVRAEMTGADHTTNTENGFYPWSTLTEVVPEELREASPAFVGRIATLGSFSVKSAEITYTSLVVTPDFHDAWDNAQSLVSP